MNDWPDLLGPADEVAPRLLGAVLRSGEVAVRLVEVEAYGGPGVPGDPGSHAHRGRTPRSAIMFGPAGRLYCYLSYGMHVCANVVVGADGDAAAVLLRAGEVVEGVEVARARRPGVSDHELARGPALLCRALGIDLSYNATDLAAGPVRLELRSPAEAVPYATGPRVGLRLAAERPWRFRVPEDPHVSVYRRHPKAAGDPCWRR
ncbi:DNA-3-methyladenine glycosylase [soil metagenome]